MIPSSTASYLCSRTSAWTVQPNILPNRCIVRTNISCFPITLLPSSTSQKQPLRPPQETSRQAPLRDRPPSRTRIHHPICTAQTQYEPLNICRTPRTRSRAYYSLRRFECDRHAVLYYGVSRGEDFHRCDDAGDIA